MLKVKLLTKVGRRGMVKIRYEDGPHPGLEEYVRTAKLIVAWGGRASFLRNEQRQAALDAYAREHRDPAIEEAVSDVLASSGEPSAGAWGGTVDMAEAEIHRIMPRAGLEGRAVAMHPLAFCDPNRDVHLPLETGVTIAQAFAAAEPETVTMYLDDQESELKAGGYAPGERYKHELLRRYTPVSQSPANGQDSTRTATDSSRRSADSGHSSRSRRQICGRRDRSGKRLACCVGLRAARPTGRSQAQPRAAGSRIRWLRPDRSR